MARLNPTNFGYQNFYSALLTADITSGTTTISVDTVPTPTSGILVIEPDSTTNREVILYTSKGASTITCPADGRGFDSTTAVSHLTGSTVIYAPVKRLFEGLASGELSTDPLRTESLFDFVASGVVWSGDSYASTRNASQTSGVIWINGRRLTVASVTSRSFTASKDTYVDASDNGDGTALLTYSEVTNNAASPALAANSIRLAIIVTGASNIAAAGSVNQGEENKVLPIASSVPYAVTDSLGNLICPRDPNRKVLGYRQLVANPANITTSIAQIIGLSVPVIIPTGRKIKVTAHMPYIQAGAALICGISIWDGVVSSGTKIQEQNYTIPLSGYAAYNVLAPVTPTAASKTFNVGAATSTNVATLNALAVSPAFIMVELV